MERISDNDPEPVPFASMSNLPLRIPGIGGDDIHRMAMTHEGSTEFTGVFADTGQLWAVINADDQDLFGAHGRVRIGQPEAAMTITTHMAILSCKSPKKKYPSPSFGPFTTYFSAKNPVNTRFG